MKNLLILVLLFVFYNCATQEKENKLSINKTDLKRIKEDLKAITKNPKSRNYQNITTLNKVAFFIKTELGKVCDTTNYQTYEVDNNEYKNIIGSLGLENEKRIIIGAHYDVYGNSEGADDNASGVVGLLELARKLSKENLKYRIDFVAYTLEEPPFFRTKQMGSYIHARSLYEAKVSVKGMLCLESIGYFNDKPNSQNFPVKEMSLKYGTKGDFITIVQNNKADDFSNQVNTLMESKSLIKTESFKGPSNVRGIDFSDHLNYWKFNYDAVMITNTALFRNKNYHTKKDVMQTLDLEKMMLVIEQTYQTIKELK